MFTGIIAAIGEVRSCEAIGAGRDMRLVIGVPGPGDGREGAAAAGVMRAGGLLFLPPVRAGLAEHVAGEGVAGEASAAAGVVDRGVARGGADEVVADGGVPDGGVARGVDACVRAIREMLEAEGAGLAALVRLAVTVAPAGLEAGTPGVGGPASAAGPEAEQAGAGVLEGVRAALAAALPAGGPVPAIALVSRLEDGAAVQVEAVARAARDEAGFLSGVALGASIACSGCCLTVVAFGADWFAVEASAETLSLTTLGEWRAGTPVNLERALRVGDELGGHMVSGHVDGLGEMLVRRPENGSLRMEFAVPAALARFVATKGSVAVDGVSLTVNSVSDAGGAGGAGDADERRANGAVFGVNVIPHTAQATTLGLRRPGEAVHIEVDGMARAAQLAGAGGADRRWAGPQAWDVPARDARDWGSAARAATGGAASGRAAPGEAASGAGTDGAGSAGDRPGVPARTGA